MPPQESKESPSRRYFASPEEAVPLIAGMLEARDFGALASYYDLGGSGIDRAELESGAFFIREERPPVAHPAGFWRYKHPFAPGFRFLYAVPADELDVFSVHVEIRIEQGAGSEDQVGLNEFRMIRSAAGWQVLPP